MQPPALLTLPVRSLGKLLDDEASPLPHPRLHPEAAASLLASAMEHGPAAGYLVRVVSPTLDVPSGEVASGLAAHFAAEARREDASRRDHLRQGFKALGIALLLVAALFAGAESLHALGEHRIYRLLSESLIIIAWVTLWIPVESLIFENLSRRRRWRTLHALAEAPVEVVMKG